MQKILIIIFIVVSELIIFLNYSNAETYYISNYGNDANNGITPSTPWNTISKLNSVLYLLKPGDAVLFERGGYFSGQINLKSGGDKNKFFIFGAYGEGQNPVISGAFQIKNWSVYKNNIYKAEVDGEIKNLFVNGEQKILARYPNSGYLKIQGVLSDPKSGFIDKNLNPTNNYWNGSVARIRSVNWAFEYSEIKKYSDGIINLVTKTTYPLNAGWGYYIDNNLNELDTAGEWFFQKTQKGKGILYYYPGKNQNINNLIIEGSIYEYAFFCGMDIKNVAFNDIDMKYQSEYGIWFAAKKENVFINNCKFSGQYKSGINFSDYSKNTKINNCRFYNINGKSIFFINSENSEISDNIFINSGMIPGYGTTGDAYGMSAIVILNSDSNHIFKNYIFNTGHDGINSIGKGNLIEKNIIENSMLLLNDGSAIKSYGENSANCLWRNNFIFNSRGNLEGTVVKYNHIAASGIYLDDHSNNIEVINNTVVNCGLGGINLNNGCRDNLISGNVCYGNNAGINIYQGASRMSGNTVSENIFFGLNKEQYGVQYFITSGLFHPAKFLNNYFSNLYTDELFLIRNNNTKKVENYLQWKKELPAGDESGSVLLNEENYRYSKIFFNMSDDSSLILLNSNSNYRDLNSSGKYGSLKLPPWSSEILVCEKDVNLMPEIYTGNTPLHFGKVSSGNTSDVKWFILSGKNLNEAVNITAPKGFQVSSAEEENYSGSMKIYPVNGSLKKIIFVKFLPAEENNFYDFINITSGNNKEIVKVSGNSR